MDFKLEFTDKKITPWGGIVLLEKMLKRLKTEEFLGSISLPVQGSNRGYDPKQLIINFWLSIWCGASKFEHLEVTRQDDVLRNIFGWQVMAGHKAFQRYFRKFDLATNQRVFTESYRWFFRQIKFDNYTLDFDSSVITRYGDQEGATIGYNPNKPGRKSHHPIIAFVDDLRMVANFWLRPGNSYTTNNFVSFLHDTLSKLEGKKVGLIRADSGFCHDAILNEFENETDPKNYIVAAKLYQPLKYHIVRENEWLKLGNGIDIADTVYNSPSWSKSRRMIMVRQEIDIRPKASGKQLRLFEPGEIYEKYRYSCYITNLTLPAKQVYDLYRGRANAENRIKEIKNDFGTDSFNLKDFYATEAALNFTALAYNMVSLFRQVILGTKVHHTLKTLKYKLFANGAYIVKNGNQKILKMSVDMKRRKWFAGLWAKSDFCDFPATINS